MNNRLSRKSISHATQNGNAAHRDENGRAAGDAVIHNGDPRHKHPECVLITGGAGFIGTNLASSFAESGHQILIFDNLARPGVERNLQWLVESYPEQIQVHIADTTDRTAVREAVFHADRVFHFAAQVAVTSSLLDPELDFQTNLRGTFNVLEAIRARGHPYPPLVFTSTNKVYGALPGLALERRADRYQPANRRICARGVSECTQLEFHSPYGCSKGGADQYVLDYARCYDLPAVVFRMSCIYGRHQMGNEDQGWVAHFLIRALQRKPITIYGDGAQVRDLLFADDLVRALRLASANAEQLRAEAFNIGGGPRQTTSLIELLALIQDITGEPVEVVRAPWRVGDQRYYVSNFGRFRRATGWKPQIGIRAGVEQLIEWLRTNVCAPMSNRAVVAAVQA